MEYHPHAPEVAGRLVIQAWLASITMSIRTSQWALIINSLEQLVRIGTMI
jgi:hypothetical protein